MELICKLVETDSELKAAHDVRRTVFVIGQNVPPEIEWDEFEDSALHMICRLDNTVVGTGRITFFGSRAKIERVAVLKEFRLRGIGRKIMEFLVDECKKKNARYIYAHVQMQAYDFYEKMGFCEVGETFDEAGINHVKMVLKEEK